MKLEIYLRMEVNGLNAKKVQVEKGSTIGELVKQYQSELPYTVLAALIDNACVDLNHKIERPCDIAFMDLRAPGANILYQRSVSFLYLKAVEDVLGIVPVKISYAINHGLFSIVGTDAPLRVSQVKAIEIRMWELVEQDIPFIRSYLDKEEALKLLSREDHQGKLKMLMNSSDVTQVPIYSCDGFMNFFYGLMVPSSGYIRHFELHKYREGVLLRMPEAEEPNTILPFKDEKELYKAFKEAQQWCDLMKIDYVDDLNRMVDSGEYREVIQISEALHEKKIAEIADMITGRNKHIILIAGPSSSGKTTFARRLCIQLRVNGYSPLYLGMDDYFLEREQTPKDEKGDYDFESVTALDIPLFNTQMNALLRGEEVDIPTFDFVEGKKHFGKRITKVEKGQPIVIEGIHGLNRALTADIPEGVKFKIYISPFTQLNIDNHNRISTTYARLLRRIVRDYQFRGNSAQRTIDRWPDVRRGENKNIFPFNGEADVFFNSVHIYELAVLKKYAEPLLDAVSKEDSCYAEAHYLTKFLRFFKAIEDDSMIANNSILREFIGGSIFVD